MRKAQGTPGNLQSFREIAENFSRTVETLLFETSQNVSEFIYQFLRLRLQLRQSMDNFRSLRGAMKEGAQCFDCFAFLFFPSLQRGNFGREKRQVISTELKQTLGSRFIENILRVELSNEIFKDLRPVRPNGVLRENILGIEDFPESPPFGLKNKETCFLAIFLPALKRLLPPLLEV